MNNSNISSVLEELYNGNIRPNELNISQSSEYKEKHKLIVDELNLLKTELSDEQFKKIEKLFDLHYEVENILYRENFIYGFKLGSTLMHEVFEDYIYN